MKKRIGVLLSGRGSNFVALAESVAAGRIPNAEIAIVISNREGAPGIERARERGLAPICELLAATTANSAFHGTRLDVGHICQIMENLISDAERRWGTRRADIAPAAEA